MTYENATARTLASFRIFVFSLCFLHILRSPPTRLSDLPSDFFIPRGFLTLFPLTIVEYLLSDSGLFILSVVGLVASLAAAIGISSYRLWASLSALTFLLVDVVIKGYGVTLNHAQAALLTCTLVLAISPAADALSFTKKKRTPQNKGVYRFPLSLLTVVILFCYTFIGTHRLIYGGFGVFSYDVAQSLLVVRSLEPAETSFRLGFAMAQHPLGVHTFRVGFFVSTLVEISSLYCLFNRKFALGWLGFMVIFHFMCLFTMNIFFWENILLLCFLFYRTDPRARTGSAPAVRQHGET